MHWLLHEQHMYVCHRRSRRRHREQLCMSVTVVVVVVIVVVAVVFAVVVGVGAIDLNVACAICICKPKTSKILLRSSLYTTHPDIAGRDGHEQNLLSLIADHDRCVSRKGSARPPHQISSPVGTGTARPTPKRSSPKGTPLKGTVASSTSPPMTDGIALTSTPE